MNIIILGVIIDTIAQLYFCRISLWWIISLVTRILFCTRILGIVVKVKKLLTAEVVAISGMFLWNILFKTKDFPWLNLLLMLVFTGICVGLEFLDEILYVYVIEDIIEDDVD